MMTLNAEDSVIEPNNGPSLPQANGKAGLRVAMGQAGAEEVVVLVMPLVPQPLTVW